MRIKIFRIFVILIFIIAGLVLFSLQIINGERLRNISDRNRIRLLPQGGARGKILDRNGEIIVGNKLSFDVFVSPEDQQELEKALVQVSKVTGLSQGELRNRLNKGRINAFMPVKIISNIDIKKALALEEIKADSSAIIIQMQPLRDYPYGDLASHILGYLDEIDRWRLTKLEDYGYRTKDIVGFGGIEERYDYYLRQEEGGLSFEVNSRGKFIRVLGFKPPKSGKDISLTIDLKIQKIVETAMEDRMGAAVVMDPYTGEIIAMVSRPSFHPDKIIDKKNKYLPSILNDSRSPLVNRAISGVYPPGSVFKIVVATAGLEKGKIKRNTTHDCLGKLRVGNRDFKCWNTHGRQDVILALAYSCDVFFYRTGLALGAQVIYDYAVKFGLGKPTGIDIPYEASGFVPSPLWRKISKMKNWFDGDTANFSIGQGELLTTPIQIAKAMSVFANGGLLVAPFLIKAVDGQDVTMHKKHILRLPVKTSTIDLVRLGLRGAVSEPGGTASVLNIPGVVVAGKTGTAQADGGPSHAWFTGYFPYKNPKYVICVFLERGFSGQVSCIVTKKILEQMLEEGLI